jgi:hypothetical protein
MRKWGLILGMACLAMAVVAGLAQAQPLIVGNSAAFGNGPIVTYDFTAGGAPVASFIPDGAANGANGRGLAVTDQFVYYTELAGGFGASDGIHIAPWNGGAGGADINVLPNPTPGLGVQDLAFFNGFLYLLSGYPSQAPVVTQFDRNTGAVVNSFPINSTIFVSDGFTVLPNGNFLINQGDQDVGSLTYLEFDRATGNPTGFSIVMPGNQGNGTATGVDISPDGTALYFQTGFSSFTKTDLLGNILGVSQVTGNSIEDIGLIQPFNPTVPVPPSLLLFGSGLGLLGFWRWKRS